MCLINLKGENCFAVAWHPLCGKVRGDAGRLGLAGKS